MRLKKLKIITDLNQNYNNLLIRADILSVNSI